MELQCSLICALDCSFVFGRHRARWQTSQLPLYCIQKGAAYNDFTTPHFISYETSLYKPGQTSIYLTQREALISLINDPNHCRLCMIQMCELFMYSNNSFEKLKLLIKKEIHCDTSSDSESKKADITEWDKFRIHEINIMHLINWNIRSTYSTSFLWRKRITAFWKQ